MSFAVILNPGAREGGERERLAEALAGLRETEVLESRGPGDVAKLARQAAGGGAETIVAAGGDGTVNEVLNAIAPDFERVRLGILPMGTGNDLARSLGIPAELEAAISILAAGRGRRLDVVRMELPAATRLFLNASAGGFSGDVGDKLTPEVKETWGPFAYLRSALEALPERCDYRAEILCDGERLSLQAFNVAVANARFIAGGIPIAPRAELDDGLLDLVVVTTCRGPQLMAVGAKILRGTHLDEDDERILYRRARRVEIRCDPPMTFNADGEALGEDPVRYEVLPRALVVVVGKSAG